MPVGDNQIRHIATYFNFLKIPINRKKILAANCLLWYSKNVLITWVCLVISYLMLLLLNQTKYET